MAKITVMVETNEFKVGIAETFPGPGEGNPSFIPQRVREALREISVQVDDMLIVRYGDAEKVGK